MVYGMHYEGEAAAVAVVQLGGSSGMSGNCGLNIKLAGARIREAA